MWGGGPLSSNLLAVLLERVAIGRKQSVKKNKKFEPVFMFHF